MTVARRKTIDVARRRFTGEAVSGQLQLVAEGLEAAEAEHAEIPDRRLALMFACAHPAIEAGVRAPSILQVLVGLETIASAFRMSPKAMSKRLGWAKDKLRQGGIPFGIPEREHVDAIYAAFAEAATPARPPHWSRPGLRTAMDSLGKCLPGT